MKTTPQAEAARRLREALDLHTTGVSLMRARLRRLHPEADATAIERHLRSWLRTRPGAAWGDTDGSRRCGRKA